MSRASGSSLILGSTKNSTGMRICSPGFSVCWVKQKHWILVKYFPAWSGGHVEGRGAGDRVRRIILRDEDCHVACADADRIGGMFGIEFPRQLGRHIGIEAHRDGIAQHLRRLGRGDRIVTLCRAAETGDAAEQIVERHRSETQPDHRRREQGRERRGAAIFPAVSLRPSCRHHHARHRNEEKEESEPARGSSPSGWRARAGGGDTRLRRTAVADFRRS